MSRPKKIQNWASGGPHNQWRRPDHTIDYALVLSKNEGLIRWAMNRFKFVGDQEGEYIQNIVQDMRVHLCRTAELFDPAKAKWGTYATTSLFRRLGYIRKQEARPKNNIRPISTLKVEPNKRVDRRKNVTSIADFDLTRFFLDGLPARERQCVEGYFLQGLTYQEVGKMLTPPITRERVRQILGDAMRRMRRDASEQGIVVDHTASFTGRTAE